MTHVRILDVNWIGIAVLIQIHLSSNVDRNLRNRKGKSLLKDQQNIEITRKNRRYKEQVLRKKKGKEKDQQWSHTAYGRRRRPNFPR
jgi:hypothetical protein